MLQKIIQSKPTVRYQLSLIVPVVILLMISLLTLYSTNLQVDFLESSLYKQMIWIGIGSVVFIALQFIRVQFFYEYAFILYGILIVLLILTHFMPSISGAKRWIILGPISFQPSELGKLIVVFTLAKFLSDQREGENPIKILVIAFAISILPSLLVFRQPDLGTAIIYVAITLPMLYWSGVHVYYLFIILAPFISILAAFHLVAFYLWIFIVIVILFISQPKLWTGVLITVTNIAFGTLSSLIWDHLYPHQKQRIITFLDPMQDPQGAGYQIIQSITAIGSGGFLGKGLGQGTQTHLRFLPVRDTDFIISVIGEEMGFMGILIIVASFFFLLYWMCTYAKFVHNRFSSLTIIGISAMLFVHMIINLGMTAGWLPVTGLPAPFISYGGSFLLTALGALALSNNIISNDI